MPNSLHPRFSCSRDWATALNLYLFFFYFSGITHLLLQLTGATIFIGLRQAVYISLLWLIPVLAFPRKTKIIAAGIGIVLFLTSLVSLVYYCIYQQEFSQSVLFIMFESNLDESAEYVAQYFRWWMLLVIIGHAVVAYFLWNRVRPLVLPGKKVLLVSLSIISFVILLPVFKETVIKKGDFQTAAHSLQKRFEPAAPWNIIAGYLQYRDQLAAMQALLEQNNALPPVKDLSDKFAGMPATLVLVIGESTNRQHMSMYGYKRSTTPRLDAVKDQLTIFTKVVASRPYTIESLSQILTFADQENNELSLTKPSLMNLMKQAGYKTYWITNQQTVSKRNTLLTMFSKQTDEQYYLNNSRNQNSRVYDGGVFDPFEKVLKEDAPRKFIVVHLLGTHMKYDYRYPPEFDLFNDRSGLSEVFNDSQAKVINAYDNAVAYNDDVVSTLRDTLAKKEDRSLFVYLSDHGEDVFDTPPHTMLGRSEASPTLAMYSVPFFIWTSPEWRKTSPSQFGGMLDREYSLAHFIHTWSDLTGLSHADFDPSKSLINPAFKKHALWVGNPESKKSLKTLVQ